MKKSKIIFGSVLLSLLALTACGTKKENSKEDSKGDEVLTVWSGLTPPSTTVKDWTESPFHSRMEKVSGIKVKWEFPAEGVDNVQAFNLLLADKKYPHIIGHSIRNDAETLINDGIIVDLTDILEEKAPNYYKFLQDNPDLAKAVTTDSGKIFAFGTFREKDVQGAYIGPEIRQDWLKEQNLEMPKNIADWENVLKVFKDKYDARLAFVPSILDAAGFSGAFGAHGTFNLNFYITKDNKVEATQVQPEWKDYMAWMHKIYSEDLIDPDIITLDDANLKTKVANDKVGATINMGSRVAIYEDEAKSNGKTADWAWVPYPNQANGEPTASIFTTGRVQDATTVVTTSAKGEMLDKALDWLDFAYSKDGQNYWNYGEKGVSWEEKDGKAVYTDKIVKNPLGLSEAKRLYAGLSGTGLGVQLINSLATTNEGVKDEEVAGFVWADNTEEAIKSVYPNAVTLTPEEAKEAAAIMNTLSAYCSEVSMQFMTGERSVDEYDDFVKELKNQGLDRLTEIKQAGYDRYLKR